jgi:hypothetical protein
VPREVESAPRNALWELFSFETGRVLQGAKDYRWRQGDAVPILREINRRYRELGIDMSYTLKDFRRDVALEYLHEMSPEEILREFPPERILRGLPAEERLRGLPAEERLRGLPAEERLRGLAPEERLLGLGEAELDRLRDLLGRGKPGSDD